MNSDGSLMNGGVQRSRWAPELPRFSFDE